MLLLSLACVKPTPDADRRVHSQAIALVHTDAPAASALCARIGDPTLAADCVWAAVEVLATQDPQASAALCADTPGLGGQECWFLLGERSMDPGACANAGALAEDCRMHVFSDRVNNELPKGVRPGEIEERVAPWVLWAGFSPTDGRPWAAVYRQVLVRTQPLDPTLCQAVADPERAAICASTATPVFHDLLNAYRDRGAQLCEGPLPFPVVLDATLQAELEQRREQELCRAGLQRIPSERAPEMVP